MKISELVGRRLSRSNRMLVSEAYKRGIKIEALPKKNLKCRTKEKNI